MTERCRLELLRLRLRLHLRLLLLLLLWQPTARKPNFMASDSTVVMPKTRETREVGHRVDLSEHE